MSVARSCFDGQHCPLSENVRRVVGLRRGKRRCADSVHFCVRTHGKGGFVCQRIVGKMRSEGGSARFGTLRPFASCCRRIPLRQNSACHNHLQHAGVSAYAQFRAFSHRQKLSKPHPCDNRKRFWAPMAAKVLETMFANSKNVNTVGTVTIRSSMTEENKQQIEQLVEKLCR